MVLSKPWPHDAWRESFSSIHSMQSMLSNLYACTNTKSSSHSDFRAMFSFLLLSECNFMDISYSSIQYSCRARSWTHDCFVLFVYHVTLRRNLVFCSFNLLLHIWVLWGYLLTYVSAWPPNIHKSSVSPSDSMHFLPPIKSSLLVSANKRSFLSEHVLLTVIMDSVNTYSRE